MGLSPAAASVCELRSGVLGIRVLACPLLRFLGRQRDFSHYPTEEIVCVKFAEGEKGRRLPEKLVALEPSLIALGEDWILGTLEEVLRSLIEGGNWTTKSSPPATDVEFCFS